MSLLHSLLTLSLLFSSSLAFRSDELLLDDEEFGLEGGVQAHPKSPDLVHTRSSPPPPTTTTTRKRYSDSDPDSKIQFLLEHAFGDSEFSPAGTFTARLKTWNHGGQVGFLGLGLCSFWLC
jgi:ER membrane protein complex subunit 10